MLHCIMYLAVSLLTAATLPEGLLEVELQVASCFVRRDNKYIHNKLFPAHITSAVHP